jgi:hypothetical protein
MKDNRLEYFPVDASAVLDPLAREFGLAGPDASEPGYVGYVLGPWAIWAVLEERNKTVDTFVNHDTGEKVLSASVWKLVRKAELKGAGQPRSSAISRKGVQKSLGAQADALHRLLPLLLADSGRRLMED